jgi:hypothetical protein
VVVVVVVVVVLVAIHRISDPYVCICTTLTL